MEMELKHLNPQHVMNVTGKAIDEISRLRAENAELKAKLESEKESRYADSVDAAIAELKAEINRKEGVGHRWFERCMEARTENIRLKRALWLMRAERASDKARIFYFAATCEVELNIDGFSNKEKGRSRMGDAISWRKNWLKVERKCRAKAEEYK